MVTGSGAILGVRITGTLGDIDPLNKVHLKRARSTVKKVPVKGPPEHYLRYMGVQG